MIAKGQRRMIDCGGAGGVYCSRFNVRHRLRFRLPDLRRLASDVGGVLLVGGCATRDSALRYLVNFTRCRQLLTPILHRDVIHTYMLGDGRIRLPSATWINSWSVRSSVKV